jgi:hypothetical protein
MSQMSVGLFNNTKHWQERAEEARVHAEQLTDPEAKRMMLEIAESYQRFVKRAQERQLSAGPPRNQSSETKAAKVQTRKLPQRAQEAQCRSDF